MKVVSCRPMYNNIVKSVTANNTELINISVNINFITLTRLRHGHRRPSPAIQLVNIPNTVYHLKTNFIYSHNKLIQVICDDRFVRQLLVHIRTIIFCELSEPQNCRTGLQLKHNLNRYISLVFIKDADCKPLWAEQFIESGTYDFDSARNIHAEFIKQDQGQ